MAQLIVRRLEPEIVGALRKRAADRGRSMEAEHREILREVLRGGRKQVSLKTLLLDIPGVGSDADFVRVRQRPRRVRF
jgi:plasmid stability protein